MKTQASAMTPEPPPPSDGSSLPQHPRPPLENFAKDTTEMDLWNFDGDLETSDKVENPAVSEAKPTHERLIPAPRMIESRQPRKTPDRPAYKPVAMGDSARIDVSHELVKRPSTASMASAANPASDFNEDRQQRGHLDLVSDIDDLSDLNMLETAQATPQQAAPTVNPPVIAKIVSETTAQAAVQVETDDEFTSVRPENAVPISLRPRLGLSNIERIGLIGLLVILIGGATLVFISSLRPLAMRTITSKSTDFPIKGSNVTVISATSYWRAPITDGAKADAFRRGTVLLPVLELAVTGGPADIRVFFRDEAGQIVGDAMTRNINGEATLKIAATAGFDDPGMHAAYRTGASKPWTIEVRETRTGEVSDRESTKLFEINVSTDRH